MKAERHDMALEQNRGGELRLPSPSAATSFFFGLIDLIVRGGSRLLAAWALDGDRAHQAPPAGCGHPGRADGGQPSVRRHDVVHQPPDPGFEGQDGGAAAGRKVRGRMGRSLMAAGPLRVDHGLAVLATTPGNGGRGRESPLKRRRPKPPQGGALSFVLRVEVG